MRKPGGNVVRTVGVVGAGTMGIGVAHCFAEGGMPVILTDISEDALRRAREEIVRNTRTYRLLRPGQVLPETEQVLTLIEFTLDLQRLEKADYVVENATEKWHVKAGIYPALDAICPEHTVFGVNTSAIPITRVAGLTRRPAQVVGTHFMNPVPLMPLVEVIRGFHSSDEAIATTRALFAEVGKESLVVADSPGFVTNRVMMLMVNEAIFLLDEGVASANDIDRLFRECFGHKMGPLETCDLIGLDTVLYSLDVIHDGFHDPKYRPSPLLRKMVDAGLHGKKTGRGFYEYA